MEAILGQSAPVHMIRKTRTKFFNTSNNRLAWDKCVIIGNSFKCA